MIDIIPIERSVLGGTTHNRIFYNMSICFHWIRRPREDNLSANRVSRRFVPGMWWYLYSPTCPVPLSLLLLYALGRTLSIKPERLGTSSYQSFWRDAFSIQTVLFFSSRHGYEKWILLRIAIFFLVFSWVVFARVFSSFVSYV